MSPPRGDSKTEQGEPPRLLDGRIGLVLGVSRPASVGYQCAKDLKGQGARLGITYRSGESEGVECARVLDVPAYAMDVLDEDSVRRALDELAGRFERLDFLVHTLVHAPKGSLQGSILDVSREDFALAFEVGVRSLLVTTRYALPLLKRSSSPRIVTLFSPGGDFAMPNYHLIGMVKGGLASAMRYLAAELGPQSVLCNGVNFSMLETDAAERAVGRTAVEQTRAHLVKRSMTREALSFEHIANTVAFLVSGSCQNMTGEILTVDGGYCRNYF
jgi:enoyl-[acyl-carrier protein] reductase I